MTPTQDGLLAGIRQIAEDELGLQITHKPEHANTGDLYAQHGLDTRLVIGYRFNTGYCGFDLHGQAVEAAPAALRTRAPGRQPDPRHIRFYHVDYADAGQIRTVLDLIRDLLAPYETARDGAMSPRDQITAILTEHASPDGTIPVDAIPELTTDLAALLEAAGHTRTS